MNYKGQSRFSFNVFMCFCFIMAVWVLAAGNSAFAGTNISGPISANTTWTASASPYTVTGGIIVRSTATLTIEAGVTVNINAGVGIMIDGGLIARGTAAKKITFTATVKDPTPEKWGGLLFKDSSIDAEIGTGGVYTSGSIMEHCIVEYAGANNANALQLEGSHPYINYCTFRNNATAAISGGTLSKKLYITNNSITSNGSWGINLAACTKVISGNTVESNGGGIYSEGSTSYTNHYIQNNIVKKNAGYGIQASYLTVSGNTVSENGNVGIEANHATVSGNTVNGNAKTGISVSSYSTATKNIITNNKENGLYCHHNCTTTENTITGNAGYGIYCESSSGISKNNVSSNGSGVFASSGNSITNNTITKNTGAKGAGIYCNSINNSIINNTITENETTTENSATIYIANSVGTKINKNRIYNNKADYELYENTALSSSYDLDATANWWGTTDENAIMGKIYDWFDNAAKNEVNYYPFANSSGDIPTPPDAGFTYSSSELTVTFKDTSTPSTAIKTWSWNFGDGKTGTEQNPSHTYAAEGIYTVSLTVTSADGTDTETAIVSVGTATPPTLSLSPASQNVAKDAGTTTFAVSNTGTGTMNWTAAVTSGTWLTIKSGASGSNSGTINCSYTANTTASARTATIRVTATGVNGSPKDITVVQAAATPSSNPSLGLTDGTGSPGSTVKVSLNFTNTTGVDVAAISTDIDFDSAVFESDATNQAYTKNPSVVIGAAGSAAGKSINYNLIDSNTLRIGVVSTNTNKIGDGVVAEVTFYIKSGVSNGSTELTQSNLSGSKPDGNEVAITGSKGTVTISNCILGDCDCNGSVSISEVQTAINMYLGKKTVAACCDRDGNGSVSISEVQTIINNYLGINPRSKHALRVKKMPAVVNIERAGDGYSLRLDSNRNSVSAISIDVAHSQELAGNISFELGASAELAGKELIQTQIQPEITRITIVSTFDNEPINDGEILFVNVDGYSDDEAINFKVTASDDDGNSVDIR